MEHNSFALLRQRLSLFGTQCFGTFIGHAHRRTIVGLLFSLALSLSLATCAAQAPASTAQADISSAAARQEFAVERSLGADCPRGDERLASKYPPIVSGSPACVGHLPEHLRAALIALPLDSVGVTRETRIAAAARPMRMRTIPGHGQRADFLFGFNGWVRSFEGPDPKTTIYLASGPYCRTPKDPDLGCGALDNLRAFAVTADGIAKNVTAQLLPPSPMPSPADRERYLQDHGATGMFRDDSRLTTVPVMRLYVELDPDRLLPPSDPRSFGYAHLGFLVWTGTRFELRDRVPRSLWPCEAVPSNEPACSHEVKGDPFVTEDRKKG